MTQDFKNKAVLVTGSSRGIGRAAAERFAEGGAKVALISRSEKEIFETADQLRRTYSDRIFAKAVDIGQEKEVTDLFKDVLARFGNIDILVNNAGTFIVTATSETELKDWNRVLEVNLTGTFLCSRELFRLAQKQPGQRNIVNIASLAGIQGLEKFPGFSAYAASKFGVVGLTECLAVEGKLLNIRVNAIAPGAVDTEMLRTGAPHLKALATPEDLARTICYFADDTQCKHITGSVLEIFTNASSKK